MRLSNQADKNQAYFCFHS